MPINKAFDAQHRAMKAVYDTMERDKTWESPEQRTIVDTIIRLLWSLARCKTPPKALMDYLSENMDKL